MLALWMTFLDSIIRKRIGAYIYCVILQLGDFRYSDLMRLSGIFWLVFVKIFCYIAVNRLKLSRINFQVAKRKSTSLNYHKSRLETSRLEINYVNLTCENLTRLGMKKTSRITEDDIIACSLTTRLSISWHINEGSATRFFIYRVLL